MMCGLAGVLIGDNSNGEVLERIKGLFTMNLLANEERGKEATGVSVLNCDCAFFVKKSPTRASQFIESKSYKNFMNDMVGEEATILLGHTRRPTKGTPDNNDNNHPVVVGDTVGIHNGTITNDDEIFLSKDRRRDRKRRRIGSVDSEAIFALMDEIDPSQPLEGYVEEVRSAASLLVGSYTTMFFNRILPHNIFLLKYDNPISVHYAQDLNSLFFSSGYVFLRRAFGRSVITEALPSKRGYVFDSRLLNERKKQPLLHFALQELKKEISTEDTIGG